MIVYLLLLDVIQGKILGGGALVYERFSRPTQDHPCYTSATASHEELLGILVRFDSTRVSYVKIYDASNAIVVEDILKTWDVQDGKCYTLSSQRTIGEFEALLGSKDIYIKWIDDRTNDWGQDRIVFQTFQFDIDGLYPTELFVNEETKQFNTTNVVQTTNGDRILVDHFNVTINYHKVKRNGDTVVDVSNDGTVRVIGPDHLDAEKIDSIAIGITYTVPSDPSGTILSDTVIIVITDANDERPTINVDFSMPNTSCEITNFDTTAAYERCLFDQLNKNGVTYATLLPPYDLDKTSPNNNVTADIFTNAMVNNEPVFTLDLINGLLLLRYTSMFDYCMLDVHSLKLKMCDNGHNQNCVFRTITLRPPPHSPNCICVKFDVPISSESPFVDAGCSSVARVDVYTRDDLIVSDRALEVVDTGHHTFQVEHNSAVTAYGQFLVCIDRCGTEEMHFMFDYDQHTTVKIYQDTLHDCLLCPLWLKIIASLLMALLILFWIIFIAYGLFKKYGPVKHRALEETYTKSFKQGFYLCCLIEMPMPCRLHTILMVLTGFNLLILLLIIIISCTIGWQLCLPLAMLLWFLIGLALATLAIFVLQYGIWKLLDKYFNKGQLNQTVHNHTNCIGHNSSSALLIREKRTRPNQDLGTILKAYKAEADSEEYKFRMVLDNDDFDCSISPPEIEKRGRDCELVFLIEGSDSFGENGISSFEQSIKWSIDLIEKLYHSVEFDSLFVSMIQFSGLKQRVSSYIPGSNGIDHESKMFHYKPIYERCKVTDDRLQKPFDSKLRAKLESVESLGGSDYLYLCLQDIASMSYFNHAKTTKFAIILGDGSWECGRLKSTSGGFADKYDVLARAHSTFAQIFTVVFPSDNFDNEHVDGKSLRDYLEHDVSKPGDNLYLVRSKRQVKQTLDLHADDIVDKFRHIFK